MRAASPDLRKESRVENKKERVTTRGRVGWFAIIAVIALLAIFAVWKSASMSKSMSAAASDEKQVLQSAPGTKTKFVLEIGEPTAEGTIRGQLLQKKTEEIYARTTTSVTVQFNAQTNFVMGKKSDIHAGAVVHITGTVKDDHRVQAEQIVILTGYVKIQ
jgi:uncharacterized protein YdeI (BOF family)